MNSTTIFSDVVSYLSTPSNVFIILGSLILGLFSMVVFRKLHCLWYAKMIYDGATMSEESFAPQKTKLFSRLQELQDLKKANGETLKILEIGAGSGSNLEYFPADSELTIVEPLYEVKKYFDFKMKGFPHLNVTNYHVKKLANVTLPDEHYDVIVGTMLLCSVYNVDDALEKIFKKLKPGGHYFFEEHILSWHKCCSIVQRLVGPLWYFAFQGCSIVRQPVEHFQDAGFQILHQERYMAAFPDMAPFEMVRPHIDGVAIRPCHQLSRTEYETSIA